jgi:hypothetical protein
MGWCVIPGSDSQRKLIGFSSNENENKIGRRFFQECEKCIPNLTTQEMAAFNNQHFVAVVAVAAATGIWRRRKTRR